MDWRYNTIWQDRLPAGAWGAFYLKPKQVQLEGGAEKQYFYIDGFKPKSNSLTDLVGVEGAVYLELIHSNILGFDGIGAFGPIRRLEVHHCVKLEDSAGLLELQQNLEWLHINTSRKFSFLDIHLLKNLKVLCLNSCGALESLKFLRKLPNLLDFRFVDTNVLDGDLTPLIEHPSLVTVGFQNKRHYNRTRGEIDEHFRARAEQECVYVYNGQWRTHTYRKLIEPHGKAA